MKIMELIRRDRRSLEYRESCVGEYPLMSLSGGPVFASHIAVIRGGISPGKAVAFVVRPHAMEAIASRQLSFEVEDVGELNIRRRALVVIAVLVQPWNWIRTRTTVGYSMIRGNLGCARFWCGLRLKFRSRHCRRQHGSYAKLQQMPPIQVRTALMMVLIEQRIFGRVEIKSELHNSSSFCFRDKLPCSFSHAQFSKTVKA